MSLSVAAQLAQGADPAVEAAMVKDLGNTFEQLLPTFGAKASLPKICGPRNDALSPN